MVHGRWTEGAEGAVMIFTVKHETGRLGRTQSRKALPFPMIARPRTLDGSVARSRSDLHAAAAPETAREFDSRLENEIDIRLPGLHLGRFAVHRPTADPSVLRAPPAPYSRAIFFPETLSRRSSAPGWLRTPGTAILLPGGHPDGRPRESGPLPLCLVLDFHLLEPAARSPVTCVVRREDLLPAREQLARLLQLQAEREPAHAWECAVVVLNVLVMLLRTAGWIQSELAGGRPAGDSAMHRLLLTMPLESTLGSVVARSGYQRDHLNRLLKRQTGLTLGQFRTHRRLDRAKELLGQGMRVGDVAGEIGLPDQSYFARWFRRQTGLAPTQWLQRRGPSPATPLALCG